MGSTYKILGQSKPTSTTAVALYTVPANTYTVCSTLILSAVAGTNAGTAFVSVRKSGEAANDKQFIIYRVSLDPTVNNKVAETGTITYTLGLTLQAGDSIWVQINTATEFVAFNLFGVENTI